MKMCIPEKNINGFNWKCPLRKSCARAVINRITENLFKEAPYNNEHGYCEYFFWKGYVKKK